MSFVNPHPWIFFPFIFRVGGMERGRGEEGRKERRESRGREGGGKEEETSM